MDGSSINDLRAKDLVVAENRKPVTVFTLSKVSEMITPVDIIFVLDETGSMRDELDSVKRNVRDFIRQLRAINIVGNLCLVSFHDEVRRRCLKFSEDDPLTLKNENIDAFLNDLNQIKVYRKQGGDKPENQLAALISAAEETPWHQNAQRMAILITDAPFHDIHNPGNAGSHAKSYGETLSVIQRHQMRVFVVGPDIPGYSRPYRGLPGIVDASKGLFFDIKKLASSRVRRLRSILNEIADNISTLYLLEYLIEDNDLDTHLPISQRFPSVSLSIRRGRLNLFPAISSMPLGSSNYKKSWNLNEGPSAEFINVSVRVDNIILRKEAYRIENGFLLLNDYPEPGSLIRIQYQFGTIKNNIAITPIVLERPSKRFHIVVSYNGKVPSPNDYKIRTVGHQIFFKPSGHTFSEDDPYYIRRRNGLKVSLQVVAD